MIRRKLAPPVASWGVLFCLTALPGLAIGAGGISGSVNARGVKNPTDVIVYIEKVEGQFQPPKAAVPVNQIKLTYVPHVLAVLVGTEVEFLNSDNEMHNVHARQAGRQIFNIGILRQRKARRILNEEGVATFLCDVHPEMSAFIVVTQNPFFAKADEKGNYSIENVPPGTYTLKAWHEKAKAEGKEVKVSEGSNARVDFELRP